MATNKKITQLDELTPATWADDDVIAIVDISAQETKKIQLSTFRGAVTGVSSLNASTPLTVDSATGDVTISVAINGGGTINAVFDEDNMASNSPTALATQQSIKAYVDSQVGTVDTLAEILANGNTSGGTNIVVSSGDVITTNTINETTAASGVTIDGVLVKDGEVDGRDVSVDGTKLDTVETNADVTDTANVTAAGALMDSELTNITAVKALDQGVATTDTPTFAGLITAGNVDGRDVSADGAKLDGIEAGADVTDTANVTAAGALMDSELTNITAVKALDQGVATTDSPSFAGLTATTADINGGTIDGTTIGGASAAAGTFTTFTSTGIDDNASSTAITIDSSGQVGIGRSPAYDLDVYRSGTTSTDIAAANDSIVNVLRLNGSTSGQVGTITSHDLELLAGNLTRMTIDSSGLVGVGVTPTYKLDIGGVTESIFRNTGGSVQSAVYSSGGGSQGQFGTFSAHPTVLITGGTEKVRIDSSGNLGVGTSSPDAASKLDVNGQVLVRNTGAAVDTTPGGQYGFYIQPDSSGTVNLMSYSSGGSTDIQFFTNSGGAAAVNAMTIDSSGNVGIGTSSPGNSRLAVLNGGAQAVFSVRDSANGRVQIGTTDYGVSNSSAADLQISNQALSGTVGMTLNVGDATNNGNIYWRSNTANNAVQIVGNPGNNYLAFATSSAEKVRINSSGETLIGTTSTGSKLRVSKGSSSNLALFEGSGYQTYFGYGVNDDNYLSAGTSGSQYFRRGSTVDMTIDSSGNVGIGRTPSYKFDLNGSGGPQVMRVADNTPTEYYGMFNANTGAYTPNAASATVKIRGFGTTGRSINAGGTVNASGADYAEYMHKADGCGTIAKGDVCGVDADGKLTDQFDSAHSFVIKSTDPSYVGGDVWSKTGQTDDEGREVLLEGDALEAARQNVDRIAFAGQVPCNITGPVAVGHYVVPQRSADGGIEAVCVDSPTLDQYIAAVGRVWKIGDANTHLVAVKIG